MGVTLRRSDTGLLEMISAGYPRSSIILATSTEVILALLCTTLAEFPMTSTSQDSTPLTRCALTPSVIAFAQDVHVIPETKNSVTTSVARSFGFSSVRVFSVTVDFEDTNDLAKEGRDIRVF